jgi:magnesium-transporting ATPase (P-type)
MALPDVKQKTRVSKKKPPKIKTKLVKKQLQTALQESKGDQTSSTAPAISVKAILIHRSINVQLVIRLVCIGSAILSLWKCLQTAGTPRLQTIWNLVHGDQSIMPAEYRPSTLDIYLSQIIVSGTNEILPLISLPSAGPLLSLVASLLVYVGTTILLPRWFTAVQVFLDYRTLQSISSTVLLQDDNTKSKASVLIHVDDKSLRKDLASTSEDERTKSSVICALQTSPTTRGSAGKRKRQATNSPVNSQYSHPLPHYFELNQCRFYFDADTGTCVDGGPLLQTAPLKDLKKLVGKGLSKAQRSIAEERYKPYNRPQLASPTIQEVFYARISSPLVVVQIIGRLLSCLEEGASSLTNSAITLGGHYFNARQAILSSRQMALEVQKHAQDSSSLSVMVFRNGKKKRWVKTTADELIPGDIFVMTQTGKKDEMVIPVDALLLDGQSLTNEAVLTGESVPQSKTPIDFEEELVQENALLDMDEHRGSVLFAGTTMVHCSSEMNRTTIQGFDFPAHHQAGVTCLALRTGTYSSKGQLLRALKSSTHMGAISNAQSEKDAMRLIASLSVFAAVSCLSLFIPHQHEAGKVVPVFRRIIQCTRIAIASIPSDLPLALSSVARSCSKRLRDDSDVICSEPGSLLTAAYVDTVVFDKTGTLTADTQSLSRLDSKLPDTDRKVAPSFQRLILAGCHSLVQLNASSTSAVGDPLDVAALEYSGWNYNYTAGFYYRQNSKSTKKSEPVRLWQLKSFPFDPNKRLSSAVVMAKAADGTFGLWSLTKGSPETMGALYSQKGDVDFKKSYNKKTQELEAQGYRSIALGADCLSNSSLVDQLFPNGLSDDDDTVRYARTVGVSLHRSDFETVKETEKGLLGLDFYGFACFDAAVRPSSKRVIDELNRSGIRSIMLTGDAIDAALAVAWKVGLIKERSVAILETKESNNGETGLVWRIVKLKSGKAASFKALHEFARMEEVTISSVRDVLKRQKRGECAIAATGRALEIVLDESSDEALSLFADELFRTSVIARATPALKKSVIICLKRGCGQKVMMCGKSFETVVLELKPGICGNKLIELF